jgi:glycosyl transferase, family 25
MGNVGYAGLARDLGAIEPHRFDASEPVSGPFGPPAPADLHIYCINLERSLQRRRFMVEQARRQSLAITFIDAIDGAQLDVAQTAEYRSAERRAQFGWDLEATEVAAALSHRKALEAIRAAGHARAIVMEDDVTILPDFQRVVDELYRNHTLEFDILRLFGARPWPGAVAAILNPSHWVERPYRPMCGLQAYMVNGASIDRIIRAFVPITMQVDVAIDRFWENGLSILCIRPFVVALSHQFESDIAASGDQWRQERRLFRLGLRAKRVIDHVKRTAHILRVF